VSKELGRELKNRVSFSPGAGPDDAAGLQRVLDYVREHLDSDLSVPQLAEITGLSASCFARWFRRHVGITPHAYVTRTRVERAIDLIRGGELSLAEIALEVGFSSQPCLNVAFRRHAGMTPGQHLQTQQKTERPVAALFAKLLTLHKRRRKP